MVTQEVSGAPDRLHQQGGDKGLTGSEDSHILSWAQSLHLKAVCPLKGYLASLELSFPTSK